MTEHDTETTLVGERARARYDLEQDTALVETGDGTFATEITDRWNTPGGPVGGYVFALAGRAMQQALEGTHPYSVTGHFMRPPAPGPASVAVDIARIGRRHSTVSATISQSGKEILRSLGTFGTLDEDPAAMYPDPVPPEIPPPDECVDPWSGLPTDRRMSLVSRIDSRTSEIPGWLQANPSGIPEMRYHQRFADGREPDPLSMLFFCDSAPPAVVELGRFGSATIELTVHVLALPSPGWLTVYKKGSLIKGGYLHEDVTIWDSRNRVVAVSRQLALVLG